jgi:hypothetical protein
MGKPEGVPAHPEPKQDADRPGYETSDVNVRGVVTFVGGLSAFLVIFFAFCFLMGKVINTANGKVYENEYGKVTRWQQQDLAEIGAANRGQKRQDLKSDAQMEQDQLSAVANVFPMPRVQTDDGAQDTADLHAREDLLLDFYSTSGDLPQGTIRIPIDKAMALVVERGLPKPADTQTAAVQPMFGDRKPVVLAPLTDGFARTGYELDTIETRKEKMEYQEERK